MGSWRDFRSGRLIEALEGGWAGKEGSLRSSSEWEYGGGGRSGWRASSILEGLFCRGRSAGAREKGGGIGSGNCSKCWRREWRVDAQDIEAAARWIMGHGKQKGASCRRDSAAAAERTIFLGRGGFGAVEKKHKDLVVEERKVTDEAGGGREFSSKNGHSHRRGTGTWHMYQTGIYTCAHP